MRKALVIFSAQLFFVLCSAHTSYAVTLYMDPNTADLKRGDIIKVSVRLDTNQDECINTVEGVVTYSDNIQPVDISRGNSILSMWVEEPKINKENRTITFAGGIPNGYCGRIPGDPRLTNNIVDLLFQSPGFQIGSTASGNEVSLDFDPQTTVLLNDGFGSKASTTFFGSKIALAREAGPVIVNPWQETVDTDTQQPEAFSISLEQTSNAFSGDYFITFNTTDKQSGIDHYEVIEEPIASAYLFKWGAETAPWVTARSPYVLSDQSLNSTIRVKAIDKAGNEYIAVFVPDETKRGVSKQLKISIVIGATLLLLFGALVSAAVVYLVKRHRRKMEQKETQTQEIENTVEENK